MAKIDLKFIDYFSDDDYIKVSKDYSESNKESIIKLKGYDSDCENHFLIYLDIPTAIKFAKTLRTEINKAKEVNNV